MNILPVIVLANGIISGWLAALHSFFAILIILSAASIQPTSGSTLMWIEVILVIAIAVALGIFVGLRVRRAMIRRSKLVNLVVLGLATFLTVLSFPGTFYFNV